MVAIGFQCEAWGSRADDENGARTDASKVTSLEEAAVLRTVQCELG